MSAAVAPPAAAVGSELAEPLLRAAVATLPPGLARVVGYHRGWVDEHGEALAERGGGGKALRPTLALLCAQGAGAPALAGGPAAVAVECIHDFSLLHDDVMDRDTRRRHRPTAWTVFGEAEAVLAGDALAALATEVLLTGAIAVGGAQLAADVALRLHRAVAQLIAGQALDMEFERRCEVSLAECQEMAAGKTAALLAAACGLGALLGGCSAETVTALECYGRELGTAFQLVDDLLGIWGDPQQTGKPVLADLRRRKKTLPVAAALQLGGPAAGRLARFLSCPETPGEAQLVAAAADIVAAGGYDWARQEATRRLGCAQQALERSTIPVGLRAQLSDVARFTIERSH